MMRPRGMPPTPRAMSRASDPVGTNCMSSLTGWSPRRMTLPLPNWRSICVTAASRALSLSKVALLSCSGRGKYCQASVHGAGPLPEATIRDDAFGAAHGQEDGLRDGHLATLYEDLRERLGELGHARRRHLAEERQRDVQRVVEAQPFVALERTVLPGLDGAPRLVGEVAGDEQPKRVVVAPRVHPASSRRSRWSAVETL